MKTTNLILIALASFVVISAGQAQEYQSQSTIHSPGCDVTTYEDGSTTSYYYHINTRTGLIDYENTVRTHATLIPTPTPEVPVATNHTTRETTPVVTFSAVAAPPSVKAIIVVSGPMTAEQIHALINAQ